GTWSGMKRIGVRSGDVTGSRRSIIRRGLERRPSQASTKSNRSAAMSASAAPNGAAIASARRSRRSPLPMYLAKQKQGLATTDRNSPLWRFFEGDALPLGDQFCGTRCKICEHAVGTGTFERKEAFEDHPVSVEPSGARGPFEHRVLAGHL